MWKIGVGSRLVAKFFQLVALVLIVVVLGGTQCVDLCSFVSPKRQAKANQTVGPEMPCHQKHTPEQSQPSNKEQCSHPELVAEKRSSTSSTDDMQAVSFVAFRINKHNVPVLFSSPLTVTNEHASRFNPLSLSPILRI